MDNKNKTKEIDIIGVIKEILFNFKSLCVFVVIFTIIGVIYAINIQKRYTANVVLAPEISSGMSLPDGISDIASMVGVDINKKGSSVDAIYPEIYPDVFSSTDFAITLMDVPVRQLNETTTKKYSDHLVLDTKIPFWNKPIIWLSEKFNSKKETGQNSSPTKIDPFHLTKAQSNIVNAIRGNIACSVDKKTNVITITCTDIDPQVAAIMADTLTSRLQEYITNYKTKKQRNDVEYYKKLYIESRADYKKCQEKYAAYCDSNEDVVLESFKSKRDELENDMQLKYNYFNQMGQQLQLAESKLREVTPAFTIIQEASVPNEASSTPRKYLILGFTLFGIIIDAIWVLFLKKHFVIKFKKRQKKE